MDESKDFVINTEIKTDTFSGNPGLLGITERYLSYLYSNLDYIELYTYMKDVYKLGNEIYNEIISLKRSLSESEIRKREKSYIREFYTYAHMLSDENIIFPYCPVINQHPLGVNDYELKGKEHLIIACTSERKTDISASYGEGLAYSLLLNLPNVSPFGLIKIANGKHSSPDFIVINERREIVLVSEVKSTIHDNPSSPDKQLEGAKDNSLGLGIQVKFNTGKSPVEIILTDPKYKLEGTIFPAIFTNISLLYGLLYEQESEKSFIKIVDKEWAANLITKFKKINRDVFAKHNLQEMIRDSYLDTKDNLLDEFLTEYFAYGKIRIEIPENQNK